MNQRVNPVLSDAKAPIPAPAHANAAPNRTGLGYRDRFETLMTLMPDWVWSTDANGMITQASDRSFDLFGRHPAEIIGTPLKDVLRPLDWSISAAPRGRSAFANGLCALVRRDGSNRLASAEARPLFDRQTGAFAGFQGIATVRDISRQVLGGLSDLFIMVENAMALAVLIDAEDCPRWANARLLESTGYTRPELRRLTMDALVNKSGFASAPASAPFSEQRAAPEPVPAAAQAQTLGEGPPDPLGLGASSPPDPSALPSPFSPLQVLTRLREPISGAAWLGPWFTDGGTGEMRRLLLTFDPAALRAFRLLPTAQRPGAAPEELIGDFCQRVCHALALLGPEAPPGFDPTRRGSDSAGFDQGTKDRAKGAITRLPRRQREVLHLLAEGRSNKAIARMLGISEATVKTHVRVLCEKLGAENRTQAASLAAHLNR